MKRLLLTILLASLWSISTAQTLVVIGDTVTTSTTFTGVGNNFSYVRGPIPVPAVGVIIFDSIRGYSSNGVFSGGSIDSSTVAVYATNSGAPGTRIWIDTLIIPNANDALQWNKGIKAMSLSFSSGDYSDIWFAIGGTTNDSASRIYGHSATSTGCQTGTGTGVPPLTWPACTPTSGNSFMIALYGHTTGGGGSPSPSSLNIFFRKASSAVPSDPWRAWRSPLPETWRWRG